jgi:chemotaxis protein MotB
MQAARRWMAGAGGILLAGLLSGCAGDPRDLQIQALQEEKERLLQENADLRKQLAAAISDRDAARARVLDLERQLAMRGGGEAPRRKGDFIEAGPYASAEISEDILFASGSADLKSTGRAKLQDIVRQIQQNFADKSIWVIGHTDTDPIKITKNKWTDNLDLSVNRGATVVREMYSLGIQPVRLVAGGQGEYNPKADNSSRAGKAQNRRVQIIAVPPPPAGTPSEPAPSGAAATPEQQPSGTD